MEFQISLQQQNKGKRRSHFCCYVGSLEIVFTQCIYHYCDLSTQAYSLIRSLAPRPLSYLSDLHCEPCFSLYHKDGAVKQVFQKSCQEVMEKALQSMQKIDELAQKLTEYMPRPTLQPFSPPQVQVYNVMQPATLFHSAPQHHPTT